MNKKIKIAGIILIIVILIITIIMLLKTSEKFQKTTILSIGKQIEESNEISSQLVDPNKWDETKVRKVTSEDNKIVPVPIGYKESNVTGEKSVDDGFVIYEGEEEVNDGNAEEMQESRNQFVWIPVKDLSRIYEIDGNTGKKKSLLYEYSENGRRLYSNYNREPNINTERSNEDHFIRSNLQGLTQEKLLEEMEIEFEETIKSIEKYGGFYIGRYETGDLAKKEIVVRKMNDNIASEEWMVIYSKIKKINKNENVKINMIWGNLWDETIQWLYETKEKTYKEIANSTEWGNYGENELEYKKTTGEITTKEKDKSTIIPTGSSEETKANNIYDLAGNTDDLTLEAGYVGRGGNWNKVWCSRGRVADRDNSSDYGHIGYGCRLFLYIK